MVYECMYVQVQVANVLFVDNPVGTGYSYCDSDSAFTKDVDEIARDLVALFSEFLKTVPACQVSSTLLLLLHTLLLCAHLSLYIHCTQSH